MAGAKTLTSDTPTRIQVGGCNGDKSPRPGRQRRVSLPCFEALEPRYTPTTLPAGFTEATVATGLSSPTAMEFAPDGRLFVLEQAGNVELVRSDGTTWTALHLNVDSQGERGLLGIAFDPAFARTTTSTCTTPTPTPARRRGHRRAQPAQPVHRRRLRPDPPVFTDEAPILDWNNLSAATNHNGGAIHFGLRRHALCRCGRQHADLHAGREHLPGLADPVRPPGQAAPHRRRAFNSGVATRDDTTVGHLIPADNPFVGTATGINQLIYALGLRNPFTFAVQPGTGTIFINDVGENTWEEIDQSVAGANFGWSGGNTDGFGQSPPGPGVYHDPLLAYNHSGGPAGGGIAIVGGTFYDPATPQFPGNYIGKYFYADLGAGWIRVFDPASRATPPNPDTSTAFASGITGDIVDLEVDPAGNLDYLTGTGMVERISFGRHPRSRCSQPARRSTWARRRRSPWPPSGASWRTSGSTWSERPG